MKYKEIIEARKACDEGAPTQQQIQLANQPLGSGAVESTCRQCQCRFKRTGQFWTTVGDESLLRQPRVRQRRQLLLKAPASRVKRRCAKPFVWRQFTICHARADARQ